MDLERTQEQKMIVAQTRRLVREDFDMVALVSNSGRSK